MSGAAPKNGSLTILTTMAEVRDASLRVANSANRVLSIFTHDLEPQIYGEELFLESVKRLVLARAYAKVRVLIADPARAVVDKNRFMAMARRLTSCIDMRSMGEDVAASAGAFIIADEPRAQTAGLPRLAVIIPMHAQVQRQVGAELPIILEVCAELTLVLFIVLVRHDRRTC